MSRLPVRSPLPNKRAFDAVRAGEQAKFRRRHAGAAVVVRVQADDERIAVLDVPANPFDLIRINIGHGDFDRVRQIQNHLVLRRRLPDVHDRLGNFLGEFHFRHAETFRRILEHDFRALEPGQTVFDPSARRCTAMALISSFDLPNTTRRCAGEVELYRWMMTFFAPIKRFDGALDQILARLHEHLEPHVVRRALFLDEPAVEGELGVGRRRESRLRFP